MTNFVLTEEQEVLRQTIADFARKELNGDICARDQQGRFSLDMWQKCADMDILALPFPEEYGGCGLDFTTTVLAIEALSYGCRDAGLVHAIGAHMISGLLLNSFGNDDQKSNYLPGICRGEIIAAQAITEADAGSDALSMSTKAERVGKDYILNGSKMFVSNGSVAHAILALVVTNPARRAMGGHSFFLCDRDRKGLLFGRPFEKMGLRTLENCEIIFDSYVVPQESLVGKEGQGAVIFNEMMEWERILFGACHLGSLVRIIEACVRYAKERKQFGQPIGKYQSISNKIARMKISEELLRPLLVRAATRKGGHQRASMEASVIKIFGSESLKAACLDAVQIYGAYGYMVEYDIERDLRDSIASTIYSGTAEINTLIISRLLGL